MQDRRLWTLELFLFLSQQEYRPDHISSKLEDRVDPQAIADCKAFRDQAWEYVNADQAWEYVNAEMQRINGTCAAYTNESDSQITLNRFFWLVSSLSFAFLS